MFHLIFDTETTGLPSNWNAPMDDSSNWPRLVSISWIITDGKNKKSFDFIIRPDGFIIPSQASEIHGITTDRALAEGYDLSFVLELFRAFLEISDVIVAHNIDFDRSIVGAEYYRIGKGEDFFSLYNKKNTFDTMKKANDILRIRGTHAGGNKWPKLIELYNSLFGENFDNAHNSMADTIACARCYFELIKQ